MAQNLVITTTSQFSGQYLLDNKPIWDSLIAYKSAQLDEPWHKVVVYGVPLEAFEATSTGMELVKEEIRTFNKGLNPIGTPYWLTPANKRPNQLAGALVVAFPTLQEATSAIRNRLYIAGISAKVEKLYSTSPTSQCTKCQGFGHLEAYCKKPATCRLCASSHHTKQHACTSCNSTLRCPHLVPKCANCKEAHSAGDPTCEVLLALKLKANTRHF
jgi:hypothetical protein